MAEKKDKKKKAKKKVLKPPSFKTIEAINNTAFSGVEAEDTLVLDGIMDFIYGDKTTDADKVKAAQRIASFFGEDAEKVDIDYVNELISETAAGDSFIAGVKSAMKKGDKGDKEVDGKSKGKKDEKKEDKPKKKKKPESEKHGRDKTQAFTSSKKWFAVDDEDRSVANIVSSANKKAEANILRLQKDHMKVALEVISALEKKANTKIVVGKKQKLSSGGLIVNFTSTMFLVNMGDELVRIIGLVRNEYELRVGA